MAKFEVNRNRLRKSVSEYHSDIDDYSSVTLQTFNSIARTFATKHRSSKDDVRFVFELGDNQYEMHLKIDRMETDEEMKERIAKEEARVAKDEENARKSKAKQEEVDRRVLENMKTRYGVEWVEKVISTL